MKTREPLTETKAHGGLQLYERVTGMKIGRCVIVIEGEEAIRWVQRRAKEASQTETKVCRRMVNDLIQQEIAKEQSQAAE